MSLATIVALTSEPYNPVKPLEKTNNTEPRTALNIWSAWFPVSYYLETTQKDWQVGQWKHDYSTLGDHRSIHVEHWDTGRTFPSIAPPYPIAPGATLPSTPEPLPPFAGRESTAPNQQGRY